MEPDDQAAGRHEQQLDVVDHGGQRRWRLVLPHQTSLRQEDEVVEFVNWYRSLDITPTIVALRKKFEDIRKKELEKTLSLHPDLSHKEKKSLEALTAAIINKILHDPVTLLKKANEETVADLYLDALQNLFQLPGRSLEQPKQESEEGLEEEKEGVESNELSRN